MIACALPDALPVPPVHLIRRAGVPPGVDPVEHYLQTGARNQEKISQLDPSPDSVHGRRILDFGCGPGKVLRHFTAEAAAGEVWGCDIDAESVQWLEDNFCPPFRAFEVCDGPSLLPENHFDLIYAISVFTHIADGWADWLLALHRALRPDGVAIVTILGEGMIEVENGGRWEPDRIGMNVLRKAQDWAGGGPTVFHSDWWINAHWGRAFDLLEIHHERAADGAVAPGSHGFVVMRKRVVELAPTDLQAIQPHEPRELAALVHNIEQLHDDDRRLREQLSAATARGDAEHTARVAAEDRCRRLSEQREVVARSVGGRLRRRLRRSVGHVLK